MGGTGISIHFFPYLLPKNLEPLLFLSANTLLKMEKSEANIFGHPSIQNQTIYGWITWSKDLDKMIFLCFSQNMSSSIFTIFSSKPPIMVTMIKLKKIGILLLLNWHKMAKNVFCVKVGDFNNFTDFTDVADFTNFKALFEPCHSNGCKVVDFNNLFWLWSRWI